MSRVLVRFSDGSGIVTIPDKLHRQDLLTRLREMQVGLFVDGGAPTAEAEEIVDGLMEHGLMVAADAGDAPAAMTEAEFGSISDFLAAPTFPEKWTKENGTPARSPRVRLPRRLKRRASALDCPHRPQSA